ncbi:MAG: hypothetical protein GX779_00825 [Clostridia bacterium]|nr:hypothetical protein [Clostridia bacterium]
MHYELNFLYEKAEAEHNYLCSNWEWFINGRSPIQAEDGLGSVWLRIDQN